MLVLKCVKYRRKPRGKMCGEAKGGKEVAFGEWGSQATESHWVTNRQIETARIAMTCYMKCGGKVWTKIFSRRSYMSKAIGVRIGKDKRAPEGWVSSIECGRIMFGVVDVPEEVAREVPYPTPHKLPVKTKVVKRKEVGGELNED